MTSPFYSSIIWVAHEKHLSGANFSLLEFMQELQQEGVKQVLVVGQAGTMSARAQELGFDVKLIPFYGWMRARNQGFFHRHFVRHQFRNLLSFFLFVRFFWKVNPELVVSFTSTHHVAASACWLLRIRHYYRISEFGQLDFGIRFAWGRWAYRFMNLTSAHILVNSKALFDQYALHISARKLRVTYNAVHISSTLPLNRPIPTSDRPKLLMLGQVLRSKGHFDALRALVALRRQGIIAQLSIVGGQQDAAYVDEIRTFIQTFGLTDQVEIRGFSSQIDQLVAEHDVLLMCSSFEAFGRVTVEAMKLGVPVIGSNSGGTKELIWHGTTGLLYEPGNADDLAVQLQDLLSGKYRVDILTANARKHVQEITHKADRLRSFQKSSVDSKPDLPRILWQAHESELSGANLSMLDFIDALRPVYNVEVILPLAGSLSQELDKRGVSFYQVGQYGWCATSNSFSPFRSLKVMVRNSIAMMQLGWIMLIRKPQWVFTNTHLPVVASVSAWLVRIKHAWWIHEFGQRDFGLRIGWGRVAWGYRWINRSSRFVFCNSHAVKQEMKAWIAPSKLHVVYQPVSWPSTSLLPTVPQRRFLVFGQFNRTKGHLQVLEAMYLLKQRNRLGEIQLDLVGPAVDPPYVEELRMFVSKHGLEANVSIQVGFFPKTVTIAKARAVIVASESEAFGRVIIEAGMAGIPVVVRQTSGGASELVHAENGLTYQTQEELAEILVGDRKLPDTPIRISYDMREEINKLTQLIQK